jgi:PTH1 family peptidyl-tRNA hydrolase
MEKNPARLAGWGFLLRPFAFLWRLAGNPPAGAGEPSADEAGSMYIFAGLGNPGRDYAGNRHNIGFMAVDEIARRHSFSPWRSRFSGEIAEGRIGNQKVMLLKPMTYMNRSGQSVGEAMRFYKLTPADVIVLHDELDILPGRVRIKKGGGHGGHNGLRDIDDHIGKDYQRVRLGIGHPGDKDRVTGYVLADFAKAEQAWLEPMLDMVARCAGHLFSEKGQSQFMNEVAKAVAPVLKPPVTKGPREPSPQPASSQTSTDTSTGDR